MSFASIQAGLGIRSFLALDFMTRLTMSSLFLVFLPVTEFVAGIGARLVSFVGLHFWKHVIVGFLEVCDDRIGLDLAAFGKALHDASTMPSLPSSSPAGTMPPSASCRRRTSSIRGSHPNAAAFGALLHRILNRHAHGSIPRVNVDDAFDRIRHVVGGRRDDSTTVITSAAVAATVVEPCIRGWVGAGVILLGQERGVVLTLMTSPEA